MDISNPKYRITSKRSNLAVYFPIIIIVIAIIVIGVVAYIIWEGGDRHIKLLSWVMNANSIQPPDLIQSY